MTCTLFRHKHSAASSSVCDVSLTTIYDVTVTDDDGASVNATDACGVLEGLALVTVSVAIPHKSDRWKDLLWKPLQKKPRMQQAQTIPVLPTATETAQTTPRVATWTE